MHVRCNRIKIFKYIHKNNIQEYYISIYIYPCVITGEKK